MSRPGVAVAIAVALLAVGLLTLRFCRAPETRPAGGERPAEGGELPAEEGTPVELYFPGPGGKLHAETRQLPLEGETEEGRVLVLARAVVGGPRGAGLYRPLPEGIGVASVHVTEKRVAFLDLEAPPEVSIPAWGSLEEMLTVYSLVDSILLNVPELEGIVLLWNGQQRPTFGGHLDTSRPLRPNRRLVAS